MNPTNEWLVFLRQRMVGDGSQLFDAGCSNTQAPETDRNSGREINPADTRLTEEAFRAAGLTSGFRSVTDGEDALVTCGGKVSMRDVPIPDLIFLDLSLPRVSGLEVLKAIKSTPSLMHIPIVVASGRTTPLRSGLCTP